MLKKWLVPLLMALVFVTAVSIAEDAALSAAMALLPQDAQLVEKDYDDGVYEYEFRSASARYDVLADASGQLLKWSAEYPGQRSSNYVLDVEQIIDLALADLAGKGVEGKPLLFVDEWNDGKPQWDAYFFGGGDLYAYKMNVETGAILEIERFFGGAALLDPQVMVNRVKSDKEMEILTSFELEWDDGRWVYESEVGNGKDRYEYKALAKDGTVIEWERD